MSLPTVVVAAQGEPGPQAWPVTLAGGAGEFTLAPLSARTLDAAGTPVATGAYRRFIAVLSVTASATAAGDTLDVYVDTSIDNGATWLNAIHFAQQAGNGAAKKEFGTLDSTNPGAVTIAVTSDAASGVTRPGLFGSLMRARWVLVDGGGGDTSHTFAVTAYGQR